MTTALSGAAALVEEGADARQRRLADQRGSLEGLVEGLTEEFLTGAGGPAHA